MRSLTQERRTLKPIAVSDATLDIPPASALLPSLWYELVRFAGMGLFTFGFSGRFEGEQHMPKSGPVLVIANHQSFLDPWLVGVAVRRHLVYLARKTLFDNRFFAKLIRSLNAAPIDQEGVGKEGIKIVLAHLRQERAVLVFPEGERCADGKMVPFRPGVHLLVRKAEATILPVGIAGAFDAYSRWDNLPKPAPLWMPPRKGTIAVSVGAPISSRHFADMPREKAMTELYDLMDRVQTRAEKLRRK